MKMPSLSIVIPTYNSKDLLQECLNSLAEQELEEGTDFSSFEVIVIDDGSTDDTMNMMEDFQKNTALNLKKQHIPNRGPAGARNLGVSLAQGQWVGFVDADIAVHPGWVKKGLELIETHPEAGGFEGKTDISHRERMTPFTHQTSNPGGRYLTCNLIVRKELCHFYPQYRIPFREDSDMAFCILESGFQIHFDENLLCYHPPLNPNYSRPFKLAERYYYDGLLCRRFPERYKKELDVHFVKGIRIPSLKKKLYAGIITAQLMVLLSLLVLPWSAIPFSLSVLLYGAGTYVGYRAGLRSFEHALDSKDLKMFTKQMHLLPAALYYWLLKGHWDFRKEPRFSSKQWKKQFGLK